tara:strand:+ start:315 stop:527 length:213 start_codon:yes stop_codon:yes gene_type:complete
MSKAEIHAEPPDLSLEERGDILAHLWKLEEAAGPAGPEQTLLNEAQIAYDAQPEAGSPWPEVIARLRHRE